jgi:hypothetical protein
MFRINDCPFAVSGSMSKRSKPMVLLLLAGGCTIPNYQGPQVQEPPAGFVFDANSTQGRNVFLDRPPVRQGAWWRLDTVRDEHSSIFISTYDWTPDAFEIDAARDRHAREYGHEFSIYGEVERVVIDDRAAWVWFHTQTHTFTGATTALEFTAVIPYDSVTYAVEFSSDQPEYLREDAVRLVVMSFAVGRTKIHYPALLVALPILVALATLTYIKIREFRASGPAPNLRSASDPVPILVTRVTPPKGAGHTAAPTEKEPPSTPPEPTPVDAGTSSSPAVDPPLQPDVTTSDPNTQDDIDGDQGS